ncbi:MAG: transcriptional repressor [Propionibacteriaceae bacterium]|nr:transcriptional repressor [Propionibacteriaceae bacterium]
MDTAALVAHTAELLRARGDRMTTARRTVLAALSGRPGHWTAEEIAGFVAELDAGVHRSSVYRCLETFSELGVVQHVHVGHGTTVYHVADVGHLHAQCRTCGRLVDVPASVLQDAARALAADHGFILDATHVALSGTCAACAEGSASPPTPTPADPPG